MHIGNSPDENLTPKSEVESTPESLLLQEEAKRIVDALGYAIQSAQSTALRVALPDEFGKVAAGRDQGRVVPVTGDDGRHYTTIISVLKDHPAVTLALRDAARRFPDWKFEVQYAERTGIDQATREEAAKVLTHPMLERPMETAYNAAYSTILVLRRASETTR